MRILFATYASGSDFLRALRYNRRKDESTLAVRTKARFRAGHELIVEVGFPGLPNRVLLRARAMEPKGRFPGQKFLIQPEERGQCEFLANIARGLPSSHRRQHRRFPIQIPARFFVDEEGSFLRGDAVTRDVAPHGVSLSTYRLLPDGARVTVILDFIGDVTLEFQGRVSWTRRANKQACVGIQFDKAHNDQMKRLRWLLRDVKACGRTFEGHAVADPLPVESEQEPDETTSRPGHLPPLPAMVVTDGGDGHHIRAVGTPSAGNRLPSELREATMEPTASPAPLHLDEDDADTFREWPSG